MRRRVAAVMRDFWWLLLQFCMLVSWSNFWCCLYIVNIPPQVDGERKDHQLVSKENESSCRQTFGEDIWRLMMSWDVPSIEILVEDLFSDEVVIHFNVFGAGMKYRIGGEGESTDIINPQAWSTKKRNP
jgi:hypothetical protein